MTEAAGCFGKIPQLGDFVSNRLPRAFVDPWDDFLRETLSFSREALGNAWLDTYLHAPIWRFALGADCVGPSPVAGTLMPSVDQVGRYFPLTIAVLGSHVPSGLSHDAWFEAAETLSLDTLSAEFDPKTLSAHLERIGCPQRDALAQPLSGALWWTVGARALEPLALRSSGLPRGVAATALFDGDWRRWGWDVEPVAFHPDAVKRPEEND